MSARGVAASWERFGRRDPYFGVLNAPRFRDAGRDGPARTAFFATGEAHVATLFATIRASLDATFSPRRALDFGCGVGRILLPIARRVPEVTGVDISRSMLSEAHRNCAEAGLRNVTLHTPEELTGATDFDFIHSYIVFQHMPQRMGLRAAEKLLARLADDGFGALHFVYASSRPRWRSVAHWLRKRVPLVHPALNLVQRRPIDSPLMQMNCYDLDAVFRMLQRHGCHRIAVRLSDHGGWLGAFVLFQKHPQLDLRLT